MSIRIGHHEIGKGCRPFIIAEAGINHNGELALAFEMIKAARKAGADCIKFQTFKAEEFVGDPEQTYSYTSQGREVTESMLEMFKRYEFSAEEWFRIKKACDEEGITFLSTPQNLPDLDLLLELGVDAIKVGSDDFTNIPQLRSYARTGLPMLLSCGMADLAEVHEALEAIGSLEGYPTVLLLCTSQYPTPPQDVNIARLKTLAAAFPMVTLGFSDHTQGSLASSLAVALGAVLFEKHFTLDRTLPGPDHWFSEDPETLSSWVNAIRSGHEMLGSSMVRPTAVELENKKEFQRVIVAAADIEAGAVFGEESFTMRRIPSGKGLPPKMVQYLVGSRAHRSYRKGEPVLL